MTFVATCLFGLERLLGEEIDALGYKRISTIDGRIEFEAEADAVAACNIRFRFAERVLILMKKFEAKTFDELFEGVKSVCWSDFIGKNDAFPVKGHSVRSKLFSVPDCQRIIKKSIVDSMSKTYGKRFFEETGTKYQIEFLLLNDVVWLMIDTTGDALHKRGYRKLSGIAPLRETLAAAMVTMARPRENVIICDPLCGSGTIAIEAAMISKGIAPGINRRFAAEDFSIVQKSAWDQQREEAKSEIHDPSFFVYGSDIDSDCVALAAANASKAGVSDAVTFYTRDVSDFVSPVSGARGTVVTNPPYGERLLDVEAARRLYKSMGTAFSDSVPAWQLYIITSDPEFEKHFGRRCDKKRPMYNGMIKCTFYQYFKRQK